MTHILTNALLTAVCLNVFKMAVVIKILLVFLAVAVPTVISQSKTGDYEEVSPAELKLQVAELKQQVNLMQVHVHNQEKHLNTCEEVQRQSLAELERKVSLIQDRLDSHEKQLNISEGLNQSLADLKHVMKLTRDRLENQQKQLEELERKMNLTQCHLDSHEEQQGVPVVVRQSLAELEQKMNFTHNRTHCLGTCRLGECSETAFLVTI